MEGLFHVAYQAGFEAKASETIGTDLERCGDVFGADERRIGANQWAGAGYTAAGQRDASRSHLN